LTREGNIKAVELTGGEEKVRLHEVRDPDTWAQNPGRMKDTKWGRGKVIEVAKEEGQGVVLEELGETQEDGRGDIVLMAKTRVKQEVLIER
jgi:hypothetical protein